jgi:hypothetical protein
MLSSFLCLHVLSTYFLLYMQGTKRDGVTGGWRKLQHEELHDDEVGGTCGTDGGKEDRVYFIFRKARRKETTRKTET